MKGDQTERIRPKIAESYLLLSNLTEPGPLHDDYLKRAQGHGLDELIGEDE